MPHVCAWQADYHMVAFEPGVHGTHDLPVLRRAGRYAPTLAFQGPYHEPRNQNYRE